MGFTLLEMTIVLILVGLLATMAIPRYMDKRTHVDERGFSKEMLTAIRYAHVLAVDGRCEVRVVVDASAESYSVHHPDNADGNLGTCDGFAAGFGSLPVHRVGGTSLAGTAPVGVDISAGLSFVFDAEGRPVTTGGTLWTSTGSVVVGSRVITVEAMTGYVH